MNKAPGYQKWPNHKVAEEPVKHEMIVEVDGETIARSDNVIRVTEDAHPDRYYFPRSDVKMDRLQRSVTTTECPFKGQAHYFSLNAHGKSFRDAVWSYEDPYEEHLTLRNRLAFYDDKIQEIVVRAA